MVDGYLQSRSTDPQLAHKRMTIDLVADYLVLLGVSLQESYDFKTCH